MAFADDLLTHQLRQTRPECAIRIWDLCLTDAERARVGDIRVAYAQGGAAAIYATAKSISRERAIIEVARLNGMPELDYRDMLRRLPAEDLPPVTEVGFTIVWDRGTGELTLNGQVIRRVAAVRSARNIVAILDAFEAAGWPRYVRFPGSVRGGVDRQGQAVKSLNRELCAIRFERDGTGEGIVWRAIR